MEKTLRKPSLQLQDLNLFNSSLEDWEIKALNVKTAFLFGNLDEEDLSQTTRRFHQERHGEQSLSFEEGYLWSQTSCPSVEQGSASIPTGDGICLHTFRSRNLCSLSWSGYYYSCHLH